MRLGVTRAASAGTKIPEASTVNVFLMTSFCAFGVGIPFALIGGMIVRKGSRLSRMGIRTRAVVIEQGFFNSSESVIVEFVDLSGTRRRAEFPDHGWRPYGKVINILYDPDQPEIVVDAHPLCLWVIPSVFMWIGLLSCLFGFVMFGLSFVIG
jgi:hypothetical protein